MFINITGRSYSSDWWFEKHCWDDNLCFISVPSAMWSHPHLPHLSRLDYFSEKGGEQKHRSSPLSTSGIGRLNGKCWLLKHLIVRGLHFVSVPTLLVNIDLQLSGERREARALLDSLDLMHKSWQNVPLFFDRKNNWYRKLAKCNWNQTPPW